ncbi:MAG: tail-specific protease, partial [Flavobacteriia bacterium]
MKRNYKILLSVVLIAGVLLGFKLKKQPNPERNRLVMQVVGAILEQGHYQPQDFDDTFSEHIFYNFLELLDPTKRYFYQSDIDDLSIYKHRLDDDIISGNLSFFYKTYETYKQRVDESKATVDRLLEQPFDLTTDEQLNIDFDSVAYPGNELEMTDRWRKHLKWRFITTLYDSEKSEEDNLSLDSTYVSKTAEELRESALEKTIKNIDDLYERMTDLNEDDFFGMFVNVIATEFDPHTNYMSPQIKRRFDIAMSGKLEGIGARLQKQGEYTKIVELISGGPAWRAGELEVGDLIIKVAQGDEEPVDIVGMRLDDAIEYIKGEKGTEVRLTLKRVNGTIQTISIIRDIVELEETYVKSSLVEYGDKTYGVINLPKFYFDRHNNKYRNASSDMAEELQRLKQAGVDGILLDLRNNGGGSLKTAIDIVGMFIAKGPVVQVKYRGQDPHIYKDTDAEVLWNGPLAVLVNEGSASASEIVAAALQDYGRAVIIGSKQTYGKGTVQNFFDINDHYDYPEDLGSLKMTIQKFYRINGGSTQLKGVTPDVIIPDKFSYLEIGEKDEANPLDWDKVKPAKYKRYEGYTNRKKVIAHTREHVDSLPEFRLIDDNARWLKKQQDDNIIPLNYEAFKQDIENSETQAKQFDSQKDFSSGLEFKSLDYELQLMAVDTLLAEKRERWHENLNKDLYIEQGLKVL